MHPSTLLPLLHTVSQQQDAISISPPVVKPQNASGSVPSSFLGFAFEQASFLYYAGNKSHANTFSQNLLSAITEKTQAVPVIRVGGTSLDHATYDPNLNAPIWIPEKEKNNGIPLNIKLGESFFDAFGSFPNAKYTLDIPWYKKHLNNSLSYVEAAYNAIGSGNIFALEIGNEPNNYPNGGHGRPKDWSQADFAKQWGKWARAISKRLGISGQNSRIYQAVGLSSGTAQTGFPGGKPGSWRISELFAHGLKKFTGEIKTVSMHYYQTKATKTSSLQDDLMNHTAVVQGTGFIKNALDSLKKYDNTPLILGEVGNALGNGSTGTNLTGVFGAALWQVDFSLYTMYLGVSGISMQSGVNFPFSLWRPDYKDTQGAVLPAFYAHIFAAEFLGAYGNVSVTNIDLGRPYLSVYAAYEDSKLARVAIINLELWDGHMHPRSTRPSKVISLTVPSPSSSSSSSRNNNVTVKKLTSPSGGTALSTDQITWGGMEWTYESNGVGKQVLNDSRVLSANKGLVELTVDASEAVIVSF